MAESKGYVYVVSCPGIKGASWVKVGQAKDVGKRISTFNTANPEDFVVHATFHTADMGGAELQMHLQIKTLVGAKCAKKEWFSIGAEKAVAALRNVARVRKEMDGFVEYRDGEPVTKYDKNGKAEKIAMKVGKELASKVFTIKSKNAEVRMRVEQGGYVVLKGSPALDQVASFAHPDKNGRPSSEFSKRIALEADGKIADGRFTEDCKFSSPSLAAGVALGRSSNGRTEWKDADGKPLGDFIGKGRIV